MLSVLSGAGSMINYSAGAGSIVLESVLDGDGIGLATCDCGNTRAKTYALGCVEAKILVVDGAGSKVA